MVIIGILIYLLFGIIGYIFCRKAYLIAFNDWSVADRNSHLVGILLSVFFLIFALFIYNEAKNGSNKSKQSKW